MAEVRTEQFRHASRLALQDPKLQEALTRALGQFNQGRLSAIEEITPAVWEQLRERASAIKQHTLRNLDYYLDLLDNSVRNNGGVVHFAQTAQDANRIIADIAKRNNVRLVTKSKSMVSEETGTNHALEEMGIQVVETDLGEYIIQLAGETPSHIIAPAMHKSRQDVSTLFAEKLGGPRQEGIPELCRMARQQLRDHFLRADMGMTGANFLVAETGTVVIFTNEGNGRMCTSLPRIHVAITGMEKLVPTLEDLAVFLRLLPRTGTGQHITSYVTFVNGPRRPRDEDGPEQFHLVIVDNGRLEMLRDPELRDALKCIRCGACMNVCPVYRKVGGHAYGWVYPGPIGSIVTPALAGLGRAKDLPFASTLCGACYDACPVKINIPRMLLTLRQRANMAKPARLEGWLMRQWFKTVRSSATYHRVARMMALLQKPFVRGGFVRGVPIPPFSHWTRGRDFPALASRSFRQIWKKRLSRE